MCDPRVRYTCVYVCVAFRRYRYAAADDVRTFVVLPSNRFPRQPAPVKDNMASGFFVRGGICGAAELLSQRSAAAAGWN